MTQVLHGRGSRGDAHDAYMARLGDVPILTQGAEKELAVRIDASMRAIAPEPVFAALAARIGAALSCSKAG